MKRAFPRKLFSAYNSSKAKASLLTHPSISLSKNS